VIRPSSIPLLRILLALLTGFAGALAAQDLVVSYGPKGIETLTFNGITLIDISPGHNLGIAFEVPGYRRSLAGGGIERGSQFLNNYTRTMDLGAQTVTYAYVWGTIDCRYVQTGDRLDMVITVHNTSAGDTIDGLDLQLMVPHFPMTPVGFDADTPHGVQGGTDPGVVVADFGAGGVMLGCYANAQAQPRFGFSFSYNKPTNTEYALWFTTVPDTSTAGSYFPFFQERIPPGATVTYTTSVRFAKPGVALETVAADVYQAFAAAYPFQVSWPDRRAIGALFMATSATGWATNPRGWLNDPSIDVTTPAGRANFRTRMLAYADQAIPVLTGMNAQGVVMWDLEGDEFPHATTYIGDPRLVPTLAPEMDAIADEFVGKFRQAGLRVGMCARPQQLIQSGGSTWQSMGTIAEQSQLLIAKIAYAKQRWGASLFYVDSNNPDDANDAEVFRAAGDAHPDVLLMPEGERTRHYAYGAPYNELDMGNTGTPDAVRRVYPQAFSVIYASDGDVAGHHAELVQALQHGDILMFRGWFSDPINVAIKSVYTDAGPFSAGTAPAITVPPADAAAAIGQTATFTATATGTAPLTYRWQKNGVTISGATGASYTTPAIAAADNGATFRVVVSNAAGRATSANATLTIPGLAAAPAATRRNCGLGTGISALAGIFLAAFAAFRLKRNPQISQISQIRKV
jgi:hypothetical protein